LSGERGEKTKRNRLNPQTLQTGWKGGRRGRKKESTGKGRDLQFDLRFSQDRKRKEGGECEERWGGRDYSLMTSSISSEREKKKRKEDGGKGSSLDNACGNGKGRGERRKA